MNTKKVFGLLGMALSIGAFPSFSLANDVIPFSRHCDRSIELNDFALIQSRPIAQNTPLSESDNGGWVAIYEVPEDAVGDGSDDPIALNISGSVNHDQPLVSICENDQIVAVIPTYLENETDEDRKFSFFFDIGFETVTEADGIHETLSAVIQNTRFKEDQDGDLVETTLDVCSVDINDPSLEYKRILLPEGGENPEVSDYVRCLSSNASHLLGGLAYHEVYSSIEREERTIDSTNGSNQQNRAMTAFGIENYDRVTTFNYAIFPALEELSGCNGSSIAKLNVEDVRCLSMDRQVEFKRYFLGLPEVIQKLFDFDSGVDDEVAEFESEPHALLVNYFNENISTDDQDSADLPLSGEWLSVSNTDGKHRYMKSFTALPAADADLQNGLISYYDTTESECGIEEDNASCWSEKYRDEYGCTVDQEAYFSELIDASGPGALSNPAFPQGCNGGVFPTLASDQSALLEHVGITDTGHPKVVAISQMNEKANEVCNDVRDTAAGEFKMIQAVNAAGVEITQFMADLDARYEGFGACEKIQAINTMSGMMDRMLGMLGRESNDPPAQ